MFIPGGSPPYVINTSPNELWFKAAVIAVPIAGGFILVLLVLLAIRVLRNDNRRHRQLIQMRHHRSLTKAQLYVADHFYQNELLAEGSPEPAGSRYLERVGSARIGKTKSNCSRATSYSIKDSCLAVHGSSGAKSGSPTYRDVHIRLDHSKNGYEKMLPTSDGSTFDDSYESVVVWGDPARADAPASSV